MRDEIVKLTTKKHGMTCGRCSSALDTKLCVECQTGFTIAEVNELIGYCKDLIYESPDTSKYSGSYDAMGELITSVFSPDDHDSKGNQ